MEYQQFVLHQISFMTSRRPRFSFFFCRRTSYEHPRYDIFTLLEIECEDYWNYILELLLIWLLRFLLQKSPPACKQEEKMSSMLDMPSITFCRQITTSTTQAFTTLHCFVFTFVKNTDAAEWRVKYYSLLSVLTFVDITFTYTWRLTFTWIFRKKGTIFVIHNRLGIQEHT